MTPNEMRASLKEWKDELGLNRPINRQDFQIWTQLGRAIASHACHYERRNTWEFIERSQDTLRRDTIGVKAEEREVMVAFFLKAMDINEKWSQEESASEFSDRTYAHLPWAQVQRQRTESPGYEDEAPPPYAPLPK